MTVQKTVNRSRPEGIWIFVVIQYFVGFGLLWLGGLVCCVIYLNRNIHGNLRCLARFPAVIQMLKIGNLFNCVAIQQVLLCVGTPTTPTTP